MGRRSKAWTEDADRPLTHKEAAFVEGYFLHAGNTTAAAGHAGYSGRNLKARGHETSIRANVKRAIAARAETVSAKHELTLAWTLDEVQKTYQDAKQEATRVKCLDMLMKHLGAYIVRHEVTGKDGGPIEHAHRLTPEQRIARMRDLMQGAAARAN